MLTQIIVIVSFPYTPLNGLNRQRNNHGISMHWIIKSSKEKRMPIQHNKTISHLYLQVHLAYKKHTPKSKRRICMNSETSSLLHFFPVKQYISPCQISWSSTFRQSVCEDTNPDRPSGIRIIDLGWINLCPGSLSLSLSLKRRKRIKRNHSIR